MKTCETCRYYMASPLQEPCESCYWGGTMGQDHTNWKAPTNADRIRAMSDEELADWLVDCDCFQADCPCDPKICVNDGCRAAWLNWMKQETKDG